MLFKNKSLFHVLKRFNSNWTQPEGFNTGIRVYNCRSKSKQPLIVKNPNLISFYTCGPTVYDSSHIGHASCYMRLDIIQRILEDYFKFNLVTVMNITDVDDKIINRCNALKVPLHDLTRRYEKEFLEDLNDLGIKKPDLILRVTDNIELIKAFIDKLITSGKAYVGKDSSVYFDVKKYGNYGKLQNVPLTDESAPEVKNSNIDFALWKSGKPGEPVWESSWGPGRPGWHIECSALASHIFGPELDIHAGGVDLRFPHHENEEAQSCAFHQTQQWVNYWLHTGHLHLNSSEKMSKSLKNTVSIRELLQNFDKETFRTACVMSHYRSNMEFSSEFMQTAANTLKLYKNFLDRCDEYYKSVNSDIDNDLIAQQITQTSQNIHSALCDDFNTPEVLKSLNATISVINSALHSQSVNSTKVPSIRAVSKLVKSTLKMLGLMEDKSEDKNFTEIMNILSDFRQDVRQIGVGSKSKDILELCDRVRTDLKANGIHVKDIGKVSSWSSR